MNQEPPVPQPTDLEAHPEVLVLFWPDLFGVRLLPHSAGVAGMGRKLLQDDLVTVPGRPGRVHSKSVAAHIFAVALLSLHDLGLIALSLQSKKILFIKRTKVVATRIGGTGNPQGLAAASLAQFKPTDSSLTVRDIVRQWFGNDTPIPSMDIISSIESEAETLGLYRKVTGSNVASRATKRVAQVVAGGSFTYEPVAELVASTEEVASHMSDRWRQFGSDDPELKERLVKDVESAIESREPPEPPDSSN